MSIRTFFAFICIAVGGLIALLAGGCTLVFEALAVGQGMNAMMFPLMVGGIPTLAGISLLLLGLRLNK